MRLAAATALASLALLAVDAEADAAPRYASPGGGGEVCTQASPCTLKQAVHKAQTGDEVIAGAGTYTLAEFIAPEPTVSGIDVHGEEGGPMPRLVTTPPGTIYLPGSNNRIAYLDVSATGSPTTGLACPIDSRVERVRVEAVGDAAVGVLMNEGCLIRDSLIHALGTDAIAVAAQSDITGGQTVHRLRNVTAIAEGTDSEGIRASFLSILDPGSELLDAHNMIAGGVKADLATESSPNGTATILIGNSNFDAADTTGGGSVFDLGGNQTAAPLFVNAGAGDYREAPGSPTIDAGSTDQLGQLDLAGNPRVLGPAPDIGAYEFVPPVVPTPGQIQSLAIAPKAFRAANVGGAVVSAKKRRAPVGAIVRYSLSAGVNVSFSVERRTVGRRAKGKCVKKTRANAGEKKCALFKPLKSGFAQTGAAGNNRFKFSGRLGNKALKPGTYHLVGSAGGAIKRVSFRIVK